jgi:hypothetical protein
MSGQLPGPTALIPVKEPPVSIRKETGWAPEPVWTTWTNKILSLRRLDLRPFGSPASRQLLPTNLKLNKTNIFISSSIYVFIGENLIKLAVYQNGISEAYIVSF